MPNIPRKLSKYQLTLYCKILGKCNYPILISHSEKDEGFQTVKIKQMFLCNCSIKDKSLRLFISLPEINSTNVDSLFL